VSMVRIAGWSALPTASRIFDQQHAHGRQTTGDVLAGSCGRAGPSGRLCSAREIQIFWPLTSTCPSRRAKVRIRVVSCRWSAR